MSGRDLRYAQYVLKHKFWVGYWGLRLGVPFGALLWHDASKFSAAEWEPYAEWFYGWDGKWPEQAKKFPNDEQAQQRKAAFEVAWRHHWQMNLHHWEHYAYTWCSIPEHGVHELPTPVPMPRDQRIEMLADWLATGMGLKGHGAAEAPRETLQYFRDNRHRMRLNAETAFWVEQTLTDMLRAA